MLTHAGKTYVLRVQSMLGTEDQVNSTGRAFARTDLTLQSGKRSNEEGTNPSGDPRGDREYLVGDEQESAGGGTGKNTPSRGTGLGQVQGGRHLGVFEKQKSSKAGHIGHWKEKSRRSD